MLWFLLCLLFLCSFPKHSEIVVTLLYEATNEYSSLFGVSRSRYAQHWGVSRALTSTVLYLLLLVFHSKSYFHILLLDVRVTVLALRFVKFSRF